MIFQNFVDHVPGPAGYDGIGLQIIGESYQCNRESQATPSRPGRVVDVDRRAERAATLTLKQVPGREQLGSGIANSQAAPVYDPAESATQCQQVAGREVAVDPDW